MPRLIVVAQPTLASLVTHDEERFSVMHAENTRVPFISEIVNGVDDHTLRLHNELCDLRENPPSQMNEYDIVRRMNEIRDEMNAIRNRQRYWGVMVPDQRFQDVEIDPMKAELRWRCKPGPKPASSHIVSVTTIALDDRFWDRRREIEAWVETEAKDDVIAQPMDGGWRFGFPDLDDHVRFQRWFVQKKQHLVVLPLPRDDKLASVREQEVLDWCTTTIREDWWFRVNQRTDKHEMRLMIRDQKDAVLCRLRWSDLDSVVEELA